MNKGIDTSQRVSPIGALPAEGEFILFENLSNRFEEIFKSLKKTGSIDEASLDSAMRDIRKIGRAHV